MIDAVATLWAGNRSLSEIAEAVGVSRSQIAGAVWRARKAGDQRFAPRPPICKPRSRPKSRKLKPVGELVSNAPPSPPKPPVPFASLRRDQCRFVVNGAPRTAEFWFCAQPVATWGGNYCRQHAELTRAPGRRSGAPEESP